LQVELPDAVSLDAGDVVWCSLEGEGSFAQVSTTLEGTSVLQRVAPNRRQAREGDGPDRLDAWIETAGIEAGGAVHLDELRAGHAYGLREPGKRVVYAPPDPPDTSLSDIARDVTDDGR
jgi:hypothetical protein